MGERVGRVRQYRTTRSTGGPHRGGGQANNSPRGNGHSSHRARSTTCRQDVPHHHRSVHLGASVGAGHLRGRSKRGHRHTVFRGASTTVIHFFVGARVGWARGDSDGEDVPVRFPRERFPGRRSFPCVSMGGHRRGYVDQRGRPFRRMRGEDKAQTLLFAKGTKRGCISPCGRGEGYAWDVSPTPDCESGRHIGTRGASSARPRHRGDGSRHLSGERGGTEGRPYYRLPLRRGGARAKREGKGAYRVRNGMVVRQRRLPGGVGTYRCEGICHLVG